MRGRFPREHATVRLLECVLAIAACLTFVAHASAQAPVRILVGFPPGGESDAIARLLVDRMSLELRVPVIVENKPGAGGIIAAEALKNAAPDGTTLMISPIAVTVFAPFTHQNLRYDPARDFAPVSLVANFQMALAVGPGSPANTLHEYIAWARANPAKATYGVPLAGGPTHFFGVMLARNAGVDLAAVPYKGSAQLVNDLLGGQLPAGITVLSQLVKHHESGKLRVLGTSGPQRSPIAPGIPTFRELGVGAIEGSGWQAFHTRAGTPRAIVERLSAAIAVAVKSPEVSAQLLALGLEPVGSTPDELSSRFDADVARWAPIVKAAGFRADE
jgi:tripartite-type tricarboxylate transporter receptor subunit TctC